jgi:hypothetical protein
MKFQAEINVIYIQEILATQFYAVRQRKDLAPVIAQGEYCEKVNIAILWSVRSLKEKGREL